MYAAWWAFVLACMAFEILILPLVSGCRAMAFYNQIKHMHCLQIYAVKDMI